MTRLPSLAKYCVTSPRFSAPFLFNISSHQRHALILKRRVKRLHRKVIHLEAVHGALQTLGRNLIACEAEMLDLLKLKEYYEVRISRQQLTKATDTPD